MTGSFDQAVEKSLPRYVGYLQQLLQIPTPRMQEHAAIRFLAQGLEQAGWQVKLFGGEGVGEATPDGPPLNIFARHKGAGGGRSLLLGAHMDTVPPGDLEKWAHGPWSGHIAEGRIYARGAHDDRSGAAILWMLADALHQLRIHTRGDLNILVTTEEEFSCGGMKSYLRNFGRVPADGYLMVDGNQRDKCIVGHAGVLGFQLSIEGPFGTAQNRAVVHTANAIEIMSGVIRELPLFESEVNQRLQATSVDPRWPAGIIAVAGIQSRGWVSNVPAECTAQGFATVVPPLSLDEFKACFEAFLKKISVRSPWLASHPIRIAWGPLEVPAMITPETSDFFKVLQDAHGEAFGSPLTGRYIGGWGDPRLMECPNTIFYGPGGGGGDHSYNEYYELADLAPVLKALGRLVINWCGVDRSLKDRLSIDSGDQSAGKFSV